MAEWGKGLVDILPRALDYIQSAGIAVKENEEAWAYFGDKWKWYLEQRSTTSGILISYLEKTSKVFI